MTLISAFDQFPHVLLKHKGLDFVFPFSGMNSREFQMLLRFMFSVTESSSWLPPRHMFRVPLYRVETLVSIISECYLSVFA